MTAFWQPEDADPATDTGELEGEIDRLVYTLYGVTDEETAVLGRAVRGFLEQGFSLLAVRHADYTCCKQPLRGGAG